MSRYTGPRVKKMRALGVNLPGLSRKTVDKRPYPPGQHGQARKRVSEYGVRLMEKQKLRVNYGISEVQLRSLFAEAAASRAVTGDKLLELVERRLDNVVFRAGFAPTIPAARQLVSHGHITVNGKRVNIASYRIQRGDVVGLRQRSKDNAQVLESLKSSPHRPDWITFTEDTRTATVNQLPTAQSVPFELNVQLVIEYYAR